MRSSILRQRAREALRGNWGTAIAVLLVAELLSGAFSSVLQTASGTVSGLTGTEFVRLSAMIGALSICLSVVTIVLSGALQFGLCTYLLHLVDGKEAKFSDLFSQFHRIGAGVRMALLRAAVLLLWMLPLIILVMVQMSYLAMTQDVMQMTEQELVTLLLEWWPLYVIAMVPVMVAMYQYYLTGFLMSEYPAIGPWAAMRESKRLMKGRKWKAFCLEMSFFGWAALSGLTLGIGNLWLNPYMMVAAAAFYRDITDSWKSQTVLPEIT